MSKSNDRLLFAEMTLQGIGSLISWNAILTALDWYNNRFPDENPGFWFPLLNFIPSAIFQPLSIIYGHYFTFNIRIVTSYIVIATSLVMTPIIVELTSQTAGFIIICALIFVGGAVNSIGQTAVFGLSSTISEKYTNAVMFGNGLSGLSITILRLICLGIFKQNSSGYLKSTTVYFAISGGILVLCIFVQMHLMKNPLVKESVAKTHSKETNFTGESSENELKSFRSSKSLITKTDKPKVDYKELFSKIWQYLFLVYLNYVITFGVLSHVALATEAR